MTFADASVWLLDALIHGRYSRPIIVAGANAYVVELANDSVQCLAAMKAADLVLADGLSIVVSSRALGVPIPERIPCGEMMEQLCAFASEYGFRVFLFGGLPQAADCAASTLIKRYEGLTIAGTYCPPLGFECDPDQVDEIRSMINASSPDLLVVALGCPKQEIWMHDNAPHLRVKMMMCVGAALDTQAGLRKRAPKWARKTGTEWLYRLMMEPRRLWRRYLIGNVRFIGLIICQMLEQEL
jgi:N-acetylglucosaminyldiphosphoundecaprenol N-acetyl-beta-D-mannosaminyltransferase